MRPVNVMAQTLRTTTVGAVPVEPAPSPWSFGDCLVVRRRRRSGRHRRGPCARHPAGGLSPGPVPDAVGQARRPDVLVQPGTSRCAAARRPGRVAVPAALAARLRDPGRHRLRGCDRCAAVRPIATRDGSTTRSGRRTSRCIASAGRTRWRRGAGADLVGGLYGVAIGGLFAGESMFHTRARRLQGRAGRAGPAARRRARRGPSDRRPVAHTPPGQPGRDRSRTRRLSAPVAPPAHGPGSRLLAGPRNGRTPDHGAGWGGRPTT